MRLEQAVREMNAQKVEAKVPEVPPNTTTTTSASAGTHPKPYISHTDVEPVNSIGAVWFTGEVYNPASIPSGVRVLAKGYCDNVVANSNETYPEPHPVPPSGVSKFRSYVEAPCKITDVRFELVGE